MNVLESLARVLENFIISVPDARAIYIYDTDKLEFILYRFRENEEGEDLTRYIDSILRAMDLVDRNISMGAGPVASFDTNEGRYLYIRIGSYLVGFVLNIDASVDHVLPYAFIATEKIRSLANSTPVELDIPCIDSCEVETPNPDDFVKFLQSEHVFSFKVIILGEANVGKTSLINRFAHGKFITNTLPTLGVSITNHQVQLPLSRVRVNMQAWDVGGQEQFRRVRKNYYNGARAAILVFDITAPETLDKLSSWNEERMKFCQDDIVLALVGNKSDLENERAIPAERALEFAREINVPYIETSALTGSNVNDMFTLLAFKLLNSEARRLGIDTSGTMLDGS